MEGREKVADNFNFDNYIPYHNEACSVCGVPAELHNLERNEHGLHTPWGGYVVCARFTPFSPRRAAYGEIPMADANAGSLPSHLFL